MDLSLTEPQTTLLARARDISATHLRPAALKRDQSGEFPLADLKRLAEAGLMGVNVSRDFGGCAAGVVAYSHAVTTIAKADPAVAVTVAVNNMVSEVIEHFGTPSQRTTWIPRLTSGEFSSGSFCLSEPGSGSDAAGMRTTAARTDRGYEISGTKAWITSGAFAGIYLVWAQTDEGITLFLVDPNLPGIQVSRPEEKMGQHASNTVTLSFDQVPVTKDAILGELGGGFKIAMMALDGGRIGIASQSLGIADAAIDLVDHFPATHPMLFARLEAARSITLRAAYLKETGAPFSREASMAKLSASEVANDIVRTLYKNANLDSAFLNKLLRDARVTRIYEGTSEIQRIVIGRDLVQRGLR